MKLYFAAVLVLLFSVGCSKTQTTPLLAEQWETGQHRSCLYGHRNLYCFPADFLEKLPTEQRKQTTPYFMETKREALVRQPNTDGGSYDTKFTSHTPMDFSVWDCCKTGTGSPAIVCDLKHKPTQEESDAFVKSEKEREERRHLEEAASSYLEELQPATLIPACGQGEQSGGQRVPYTGKKYDFRENTHIKYPFGEFKFIYLGKHEKDTPGKSCDTASASCTASYYLGYAEASSKVWTLDFQVKYHEAALEVVQNIPCLFSQVQLRNNRHLPRDQGAIPEF